MITIDKISLGSYQGQEVYQYTLQNSIGFKVSVLNLGGIITQIIVKDKHDMPKNVVLGYKDFETYIGNGAYAGAIVGRTSGRIANATFQIDGETYHLDKNNGENSLHGGVTGLTHQLFQVETLADGITLRYHSPDGEGGYPAAVDFEVTYKITEANTLAITYTATVDARTYINLTHHNYFNLAGDSAVNGDEQLLQIDADKVCELKDGLIPTGNFIDVTHTTFDLRQPKLLKEGIAEGHSQFAITRAYDHPFVLNPHSGLSQKPQVVLHSPHSGITMKAYTTQPVAVIYTGNYLDDVPVFDAFSDEKEKSTANARYAGVAIELQDYPDGINQPAFGTKIVEKGAVYKQESIYKFFNN